jgi:hypothetical protein
MPATRSKGPYVPRADGRLRDWLDNFVAVAARDPASVCIAPAAVTAPADLADRYRAAHARAVSPATRTRPNVAAKNAARRAAWDAFRPVAMRVKHDRSVPDSLKVELGIYPRRAHQSRIPRPRTAPQLTVDWLTVGAHRLRYHDPANPARFAKPPCVVSAELLIHVGPRPATDPADARRVHRATRHVFTVRHAPRDAGRTATYFARWVTKRGLAGPWSLPLSLTIQ